MLSTTVSNRQSWPGDVGLLEACSGRPAPMLGPAERLVKHSSPQACGEGRMASGVQGSTGSCLG